MRAPVSARGAEHARAPRASTSSKRREAGSRCLPGDAAAAGKVALLARLQPARVLQRGLAPTGGRWPLGGRDALAIGARVTATRASGRAARSSSRAAGRKWESRGENARCSCSASCLCCCSWPSPLALALARMLCCAPARRRSSGRSSSQRLHTCGQTHLKRSWTVGGAVCSVIGHIDLNRATSLVPRHYNLVHPKNGLAIQTWFSGCTSL